jgi:hypothetical protein
VLEDKRIDECSGIAASRRNPGLLWTHNDSGDTARTFVLDRSGKTVAEVELQEAEARDWEDIAIAGTATESYVYVGDIGDNLRGRRDVVVYRFREPEIKPAALQQHIGVTAESLTLTYPDGPHDAETLIATTTGELILVTKDAAGSQIFKTPRVFEGGTRQELVQIGRIDLTQVPGADGLATGGDLSPDGKHVVVRTYFFAFEWTLPAVDAWQEVWKTTPRTWKLPHERQGEAICYSADGHNLFTSSEQLPTVVNQLDPQ